MKVKFLGTSAGWPLPRLGCDCTVCSSTDPRDKRTRSQLLINEILLLDVGPDTYWHLSSRGVDPRKIKYAAITHEHSDHTSGLWDLGHIYKAQKISVILAENTYKKIRKLFFYKEYKILKTQPGKKVVVASLEATLLPVNHTDSSYGIFIRETKSRKTLFYAPDFKSIPESTLEKIAGVDTAIFDGSELKISIPTHKSILENIKIGRTTSAKSVYFSHLGHRTLPYTQLQRLVQEKGDKRFNIPYDGLEIKI
jgi:phosphoribosyl 1,2-cyclic phosphate phosphodiesterase